MEMAIEHESNIRINVAAGKYEAITVTKELSNLGVVEQEILFYKKQTVACSNELKNNKKGEI
ncbi:hypothetical protein K2F43_00845 [Clostridium estertheticum]|uniref:hypothetical protein n=1 Tax=Clostridium estertheticum TaxID=238834 RepID=UPI001C6F2732|nr:hypothetical protein [Clostridium estertheticum]MBW9169748.1 hypothetical protein [Clostridium estertheticum]WLC74746.1 hypothetical protein KTC99_18620 [Clostridium estertheticum]